LIKRDAYNPRRHPVLDGLCPAMTENDMEITDCLLW
jgi:hypothetical protein